MGIDQLTNLNKHLKNSFFSDSESALINELLSLKQNHLFADWDEPGTNDSKKKDFIEILHKINNSYPGGLSVYISNAKVLLADSCKGANPFEGYTPKQPEKIDLTQFDDSYTNYEKVAMDNLHKIAVVLVAGGMGERLGFSGIKLDIPVETITGSSYFMHYTSVIKAMEERIEGGKKVPFIIMTSGQTHSKTIESLEKHNYYGLAKEQVTILMQELVPAISDNEGSLALDEKYSLVLKPHGHGDIHMLLHTSGTAKQLAQSGISHLVFIQDTNGQVFNAAFAAVGVSIEKKFDFNSLAVNRVPGEAVGALTTLVNKDKEMTLNVEYNVLDPLLKDTICPAGDVAGEDGFSLFPGNINVLVINLEPYIKILEKSSGIIAEFVNPKYTDDTKTKFKKPTRLETMMQDLPKLFSSSESVGVTIFDRVWCFSADKNNIKDAKLKFEQSKPPESACTAESDFYLTGRTKLKLCGATLSETTEELIQGIPFKKAPQVLLTPSFALTTYELKEKIKNCVLKNGSVLVLNGKNITIDNLVLEEDSALIINSLPNSSVIVKDITISNKGFELYKLSEKDMNDPTTPEELKIRGFRYNKVDAKILNFTQTGTHKVEI